ncbi:MAG: hydrolase [Verrucomicrobiales bacterium]|nr:hydrolase [Verrucomicrobiales bacterium]
MPAARKAAAVCYRLNPAGEPEFLLVRNTANTQWVFPKGTMEVWEAFGHETAARETWEEAGARGEMEARRLGVFRHRAWLKKSREWATQQVETWLMRVTDTDGTPEPGRAPTWFPLAQAHLALKGRAGTAAEEGTAAWMLGLAAERIRTLHAAASGSGNGGSAVSGPA